MEVTMRNCININTAAFAAFSSNSTRPAAWQLPLIVERNAPTHMTGSMLIIGFETREKKYRGEVQIGRDGHPIIEYTLYGVRWIDDHADARTAYRFVGSVVDMRAIGEAVSRATNGARTMPIPGDVLKVELTDHRDWNGHQIPTWGFTVEAVTWFLEDLDATAARITAALDGLDAHPEVPAGEFGPIYDAINEERRDAARTAHPAQAASADAAGSHVTAPQTAEDGKRDQGAAPAFPGPQNDPFAA